MPGYCVVGTVGHKVLNGAKKVEFENPRMVVDVKMAVEYMSFSAHADAKGIMQLIQYCQPKNVMLVHGDAEKMVFLKSKIEQVSVACLRPPWVESDRRRSSRQYAIWVGCRDSVPGNFP